ncbi:hypothetical protein K491DRAFT_325532 [Lophiostoma macrostomum CBS 122681]|uniref:Uncharacterized protein n=1 Tax=Lophiostoma macrostomum CBS 122681 TaxID=1314788 RepID=A0A6A6SLF0_9PLEO|nr:hypothetical protein K491DRAFT_325532 [Lophiostoma macrostomum CBS 122681]
MQHHPPPARLHHAPPLPPPAALPQHLQQALRQFDSYCRQHSPTEFHDRYLAFLRAFGSDPAARAVLVSHLSPAARSAIARYHVVQFGVRTPLQSFIRWIEKQKPWGITLLDLDVAFFSDWCTRRFLNGLKKLARVSDVTWDEIVTEIDGAARQKRARPRGRIQYRPRHLELALATLRERERERAGVAEEEEEEEEEEAEGEDGPPDSDSDTSLSVEHGRGGTTGEEEQEDIVRSSTEATAASDGEEADTDVGEQVTVSQQSARRSNRLTSGRQSWALEDEFDPGFTFDSGGCELVSELDSAAAMTALANGTTLNRPSPVTAPTDGASQTAAEVLVQRIAKCLDVDLAAFHPNVSSRGAVDIPAILHELVEQDFGHALGDGRWASLVYIFAYPQSPAPFQTPFASRPGLGSAQSGTTLQPLEWGRDYFSAGRDHLKQQMAAAGDMQLALDAEKMPHESLQNIVRTLADKLRSQHHHYVKSEADTVIDIAETEHWLENVPQALKTLTANLEEQCEPVLNQLRGKLKRTQTFQAECTQLVGHLESVGAALQTYSEEKKRLAGDVVLANQWISALESMLKASEDSTTER